MKKKKNRTKWAFAISCVRLLSITNYTFAIYNRKCNDSFRYTLFGMTAIECSVRAVGISKWIQVSDMAVLLMVHCAAASAHRKLCAHVSISFRLVSSFVRIWSGFFGLLVCQFTTIFTQAWRMKCMRSGEPKLSFRCGHRHWISNEVLNYVVPEEIRTLAHNKWNIFLDLWLCVPCTHSFTVYSPKWKTIQQHPYTRTRTTWNLIFCSRQICATNTMNHDLIINYCQRQCSP